MSGRRILTEQPVLQEMDEYTVVGAVFPTLILSGKKHGLRFRQLTKLQSCVIMCLG